MGATGEIANVSLQLAFGVTGMVLLTIFIIVFFVIYQRRLLQEQLKRQRIESDYQKSLLNAGILAQEVERRRMAIDLHDGIGGLLSVVKLYLDKIDQGLPEEQFTHLKAKAMEALTENIREVRSITKDLLPQSLERVGLVAACRDLCARVEELKGIPVTFSANETQRFDLDREKALFRIIQELTNNALKYTQAEQISLQFLFTEQALTLQYQEKGGGFDLQQIQKHTKGLGLKSIESRLAFLDAQMDYQSAPNQGVSVTITLNI